jgi:hypothetical protein
MRALIRADLKPADHFLLLWNDRKEYDDAVIRIFLKMGYAPAKTGQKELEDDAFVKEIIQDMPPDIKEQETQHLIMLGYTGEGQSHFVVTGVNPTEIHIRIKGRLFGRLRRACANIFQNSRKIRSQWRISRFGQKLAEKDVLPYLEVRHSIEVMEPMRDHPTILGEIIDSPLRETIRQNTNEIYLALFTFVGSVTLFFLSPVLAPLIQNFFVQTFQTNIYDVDYIRGALERTYSAFLVSFAIAALGLSIRYFDLRHQQPIKWDPDIESRQKR